MNIGGMGARMAFLQKQMGQTPCVRCRLLYDPKENEVCPHCGGLDQAELERFLDKKALEREGNHFIGKIFFIIALALIIYLWRLVIFNLHNKLQHNRTQACSDCQNATRFVSPCARR